MPRLTRKINPRGCPNMRRIALDQKLYDIGLRRSIYPTSDAKLLGVGVSTVKESLRRLRAAGHVYVNGKTKPGYWGGVEQSYRSNP